MATESAVREIRWSRNYDRARQESAADKFPVLVDFSAAPM